MNIPMKAGMSVCQELLSLENPPGSFAIIAGVGGNYNGFVWGFRCDVQMFRDAFVGSLSLYKNVAVLNNASLRYPGTSELCTASHYWSKTLQHSLNGCSCTVRSCYFYG